MFFRTNYYIRTSFKKESQPLYPGYSIETIKLFRLTNLDLPYWDLNEYKLRQKNPKDYAPDFKEGCDVKTIFQNRIDDHIHFQENYKKKILKRQKEEKKKRKKT